MTVWEYVHERLPEICGFEICRCESCNSCFLVEMSSPSISSCPSNCHRLMFDLQDAKHFRKEYDPAFWVSIALQLGYEVEEFLAAQKRGETHDFWESMIRDKIRQCYRLFWRREEEPDRVSPEERDDEELMNTLVERAEDRFEKGLRDGASAHSTSAILLSRASFAFSEEGTDTTGSIASS